MLCALGNPPNSKTQKQTSKEKYCHPKSYINCPSLIISFPPFLDLFYKSPSLHLFTLLSRLNNKEGKGKVNSVMANPPTKTSSLHILLGFFLALSGNTYITLPLFSSLPMFVCMCLSDDVITSFYFYFQFKRLIAVKFIKFD